MSPLFVPRRAEFLYLQGGGFDISIRVRVNVPHYFFGGGVTKYLVSAYVRYQVAMVTEHILQS